MEQASLDSFMRRPSKPSVAAFAVTLSFVAILVNCQFYSSPSVSSAKVDLEPTVYTRHERRVSTARNPVEQNASVQSTAPTDFDRERATREYEAKERAAKAEKERLAMVASERADAERRARELAAVEREQFLSKYLNRRSRNAEPTIAIVTSSTREDSSFLSSTLAENFQGDTFRIDPSFFQRSFVSDGMFDEAWDESAALFRKLELQGAVEGLILAREEVRFVTSPELENLVSATISLAIKVVPISGSVQRRTWNFQAVGPGFSESQAHSAARERLVKRLKNETELRLK